MREISEETYLGVNDFICGLNKDQLKEFHRRMKEKQPNLHDFFICHILFETNQKILLSFNSIFALIIRSYEYEYGEFPILKKDRLVNFHHNKSKQIVEELKLNSREKILSDLRTQAGQSELISFIDLIVDGTLEKPSPYSVLQKSDVKFGIYLAIIFLNQEMEIINN